jgi:hypothetical protein
MNGDKPKRLKLRSSIFRQDRIRRCLMRRSSEIVAPESLRKHFITASIRSTPTFISPYEKRRHRLK